MAIKTKEELLNSISARLGDDTGDEALALIEDVTDTLGDYESRVSDSTNWKQKFEENDREWREKYKSRFFEGVPAEEERESYTEEPTPMTSFDQLFSVKEGK